jgi:hypothetical protein
VPLSVTWALMLAVALAACDGGDDEPDADAGPPSITLATGAEEIEELTEGGDIYIVQGPQGGFHFYGSFYASGIEPGDPDDLSDPDNPTGEFRVFEGATRVDIAQANEFTQGLEPIPGTGGVGKIGRLVILDISDDAELDGASVRFEVEVTDVHGVTVSDQRMLTAIPHPANL